MFARRMRLTGAINKESDAINAATAERVNDQPCAVVAGPVVDTSGPRSSNRRSREDYNRYMREYMRLKRSGFIGIPYG